MICHVLRLPEVAKCGVCGRRYPSGYAAICQVEDTPLWVVVCKRARCRPSLVAYREIRLDDRFECLACTDPVRPGYVVISDEVEFGRHFVIVCHFCTSGLAGADQAGALLISPVLARTTASDPGGAAEDYVRRLLEGP